MGAAIVVAILVGVPLLAWWAWRVGSRPAPEQPGVRLEPDPRPAVVRVHDLTPAEADAVHRAVTWGRELTEPRLRAAAVDWATRVETAAQRRRERRAQAEAWLVVLAVVAGAAAIGYAVFAVVADRGDDVPWFTAVQWLLFAAIGWRRRQGPARAIALNSGPAQAG